MKAWVYKTSTYSYNGWMVEVNNIEDLFKVLDEWNAKNNGDIHELVIRRYGDKEKMDAIKENRPVRDIAVEIYDDYRE